VSPRPALQDGNQWIARLGFVVIRDSLECSRYCGGSIAWLMLGRSAELSPSKVQGSAPRQGRHQTRRPSLQQPDKDMAGADIEPSSSQNIAGGYLRGGPLELCVVVYPLGSSAV
jgi:hypothetical protein